MQAAGADRVDLYDAKGRHTGYALVDRQTGRVDFYDVNSRRIGWDRIVSPSGRAERFDLSGRRHPDTVLPVPPPQTPGGNAGERRR